MSYRVNMPTEDRLAVALPALYESFSYRKYSMAKFEEYSFYSDNRKFLPDEGIIAFNNSDGRLMALKPDITLSIVKNAKIAESSRTKLYYNETVYRMGSETRDYREIRQIGTEVLGQVDAYTQSEMCYLALRSLEEIDPDFILCLSHMGLAVHYVDTLPIADEDKKQLIRALSAKSTHEIRALCEHLGVQADTLCALCTLSGTPAQVMDSLRALCTDDTMRAAADEIDALMGQLSCTPLAEKVRFDASVINHIDYYNGLIFKGYVKNCPGAVLSGGRYDLLAQRIRESAQALGFAVYLDGLNLYYPAPVEYDTDVLVIAGEDTDGLLAAVSGLAAQGHSVRVAESAEGVRAKRVCRYEGGKLC